MAKLRLMQSVLIQRSYFFKKAKKIKQVDLDSGRSFSFMLADDVISSKIWIHVSEIGSHTQDFVTYISGMISQACCVIMLLLLMFINFDRM